MEDGDVFESKNDEDDDDDDEKSVDLSQLKSEVSEPVFQEFLNQFNPLPRKYLEEYLDDVNIDPNGMKYDITTSKWSIGKSPVKIDGDDIIVENVRYKGTPGLYELLFKTTPIGVKPDDEKNYKHIMERTNLYRLNFDPLGKIKGNKSQKYKTFVHPALYGVKQRVPSLPTGKGLLTVNNRRVEYRYFDNPNELVKRLVLLRSALDAGNNGVRNEIIAIEEELKEMNIIE